MPTVGVITSALGLAAGGNLMVLAASVVEPATSTGGPGLTPWLTGGGSAAAVAGLVYVARMVVKGDLVPRNVERREQESAERLADAAKVTRELVELAHEAQARETVLANMGGEAVRALTLDQETRRQTTEELRWWREQRERQQRRGGQRESDNR